MITSIRLCNFKCFSNECLTLSPLTVLSGINGMGKSSLIQALLLLRQSFISGTHEVSGALLNGPLIALGKAEDVLYENAQSDDSHISFEVALDNNIKITWSFAYEKNCGMLPLNISDGASSKISQQSLFGTHFAYLKAERIGPRTSFPVTDHELAKYNPLGNAGEYCAHILARKERTPLQISGLMHPSKELNELRAQTEAWLSEIGQEPRIHLQEYPKMDLVNLEFSFIKDGLPSMNYRPTNVGFGLTYSLPVFVSVLNSIPGSMIMIENPEAHLHPRGQVAMGKFLALAASHGVQIIIETHSDHILNGIRIAVKNKVITSNNVTLHFFDRSKNVPCCEVTTPKIDDDGRLDHWPDGFFDEWEKELAELL